MSFSSFLLVITPLEDGPTIWGSMPPWKEGVLEALGLLRGTNPFSYVSEAVYWRFKVELKYEVLHGQNVEMLYWYTLPSHCSRMMPIWLPQQGSNLTPCSFSVMPNITLTRTRCFLREQKQWHAVIKCHLYVCRSGPRDGGLPRCSRKSGTAGHLRKKTSRF